MKISVSPDLERRIVEKLRSGRYGSVEEVIREGLESLDVRDRKIEIRMAEDAQPISETFRSIAQDVPESEWSKVPSDFSKHVDYYLYGSAKASE